MIGFRVSDPNRERQLYPAAITAAAFLVELPILSAFGITPALTMSKLGIAPQAPAIGFGGWGRRSHRIDGAVSVNLLSVAGAVDDVSHCGCLVLSITA